MAATNTKPAVGAAGVEPERKTVSKKSTTPGGDVALMLKRCARPPVDASRNGCRNSARVEACRIALQLSLRRGAQIDMVDALAGTVCEASIREQLEGHHNHRLSVDVLLAALAQLPVDARATIAGNLLDSVALAVAVVDHHEAADPLAALTLLVAEVGDVAREIATATADGTITSTERTAVLRELSEAEAALSRLKKAFA